MSPCDCPLCELDRRRRAAQARWLYRPLPWYRRYNRCDWAFLAVCLAGAAACIYVVTR